jgi:hypothetical protein
MPEHGHFGKAIGAIVGTAVIGAEMLEHVH